MTDETESELIEAKGQRKSTPAKPSERVHGSKRNSGGSAADGHAVTFTPEITKSLQSKVTEHNSDSKYHTTLAALKAVYRRGAGAFSTSHRPGMTRNQWAMGRVNAFLYLLNHGSPENAKYVTDNDLLPSSHPRATSQRTASEVDDGTHATISHIEDSMEITEASDGRPLIQQLPELLANVVTMYHLTHGAHWTVKGQDFAQYHELFGEIYEDVFDSIDTIAEFMLKLGYDTPYSMTDFMSLRTMQDPADPADGESSLAQMVLGINDFLLVQLMAIFDQASAENQQGVANFLAERIDMHQKWAWQLRASLGIQSEQVAEADGVVKTDMGMKFPAAAYAYVPDPQKPSTWKMRLWESPDQKITRASVARAAMALSPSGYRGNQVQLPKDDVAAVRQKVATAWRSVHEGGDKMPAHLAEGQDLEMALAEGLSSAMRKRHATVVRTLPTGAKEYKFPIPDKAHARAALSYLHRSDLTAAERAKVMRKAHKVLGTSMGASKMGESVDILSDVQNDIVSEQDFAEAIASMGSMLTKNEMVVTIITPGLNRSGSRYYPSTAIAEAITNGMFNGRKMFVNHASASEMRDRPERSLTDWVSTIKETWIDEKTGAAQARIKIVQNWFGDFLKQLQENDSLPDVGLSIYAQGQVQRKKVDGRLTDVVERFTRALSVDWVTEPGAGGRVDAIWESYQPARAKEQEINVLNTMTATDAVATLREQRPDIIEVFESDTTRLEELSARVAELETEIAERDAQLVEAAEAAAKAELEVLVTETLAEAELPAAAADRVRASIVEPMLSEDHTLDREAAELKINELVEAEKAYAEQIISESRPASTGRGISGLGDRHEATPTTTTDKVESDIARRMGFKDAQ